MRHPSDPSSRFGALLLTRRQFLLQGGALLISTTVDGHQRLLLPASRLVGATVPTATVWNSVPLVVGPDMSGTELRARLATLSATWMAACQRSTLAIVLFPGANETPWSPRRWLSIVRLTRRFASQLAGVTVVPLAPIACSAGPDALGWLHEFALELGGRGLVIGPDYRGDPTVCLPYVLDVARALGCGSFCVVSDSRRVYVGARLGRVPPTATSWEMLDADPFHTLTCDRRVPASFPSTDGTMVFTEGDRKELGDVSFERWTRRPISKDAVDRSLRLSSWLSL